MSLTSSAASSVSLQLCFRNFLRYCRTAVEGLWHIFGDFSHPSIARLSASLFRKNALPSTRSPGRCSRSGGCSNHLSCDSPESKFRNICGAISYGLRGAVCSSQLIIRCCCCCCCYYCRIRYVVHSGRDWTRNHVMYLNSKGVLSIKSRSSPNSTRSALELYRYDHD